MAAILLCGCLGSPGPGHPGSPVSSVRYKSLYPNKLLLVVELSKRHVIRFDLIVNQGMTMGWGSRGGSDL